jgi:tetraacyldisaccharide 4'-kinase
MFKRLFLFPFSLLYYCITAVRNFLFDQKIWISRRFSTPVICVGNLKVGGTGKTPHVEYLIKLLSPYGNSAILSRGYGRKTKGFLEVTKSLEVDKAGDEPTQYRKKFSDNVRVFVCEDRCLGIDTIRASHSQTDVIVLDDAFQHRKVKAGLNILLTEYSKPFFEDYIMPSGWLRESRRGANRADIVIVTKCPEAITEEKQSVFQHKIQHYAGVKPIFYTTYNYSAIQPVFDDIPEIEILPSCPVLALTGIANSKSFVSYLKSKFDQVISLNLKDHHQYKSDDKDRITKSLKVLNSDKAIILTTEKDAVKIRDLGILNKLPIFYIPIEVVFLDKEDEFRSLVQNFVTLRTID